MSVFVDASVIVAILSDEDDGASQLARLGAAQGQLYFSSLVVYEATFGLARKKAPRVTAERVREAQAAVIEFLDSISAKETPISGAVTGLAVETGAAFGKGVGHPARLNMGDCFAYACARSVNATLLFKGDDFTKTDIASA